MDKQRAEKLLDKVFNSPYSHENYEEFIHHLLNKVNIDIVNQNSRIGVESFFTNFVDNFDFFGTYQDTSGKTTDILSIKLARDNSKIRARVKQRDIVARWLKKTGNNCALVAFYDDTDDWRFSFVELEYKTIKTEDGKVKDLQDLTPARRLSFLVGKNEPNHTCKNYLIDFILEDSKLPSLDSIRNAFGIESVSKEFFDKYKDLYKELLESLDDIVSKDERIKTEFKNKDISSSEFAKKLLGQIVFIYFLQKKGWLGVSKTGKWGSGRKDFLRAVFEKKFGDYENFFNDVLEPLFYNAFASSERDNDYYRTLDCRIPFLNGGLFEPIGRYDWVSTDITIGNEIFRSIFDTFDEFNFTIKEDEPLEKEVAVDPEMLGKIFESLLENNLRKGYGAFYTPREIVHYICQETLVNYLDDNSTVDRKAIDALIRQGHAVAKNDNIRPTLIIHKEELDKLLADIRVVDPAVGSGAFPVGMLSEIVNARLILGELKNNGKNLTPYQLKRDTIENSLYGVDIDAGAVDIAKLRFWLSLVIDEENENHIDPLPNLEQKIMCGDSLLEKFHNVKLFDESLIEKDAAHKTRIDDINILIKDLYDKLSESEFGADTSIIQGEIDKLKKERENLKKEHKASGYMATVLDGGSFGASEAKLRLRELKHLQSEFFNETIKSRKEKLRKEIDNLEWKFVEDSLRAEGHGEDAVEEVRLLKKKRSKPFFLWRLYFSDVFSEKGGFDVVIGNPPYVQIQGMQEDYKVALEKEGYETFAKTGDLYSLFYERGYELLRDGGVLGLITSNKWMRAGYGKKTRNFFANNTNPLTLIDFAGQKIFDSATVDVNILIFLKGANKRETKACIVKEKCSDNLSDYIEQNFTTCCFDNEDSWVVLSPIEQQIKEKIEKVGTPLKDWDINIYRGVLTGYNEAFIIDGKKKDELIAEDPKSAEIIRPILRGRDIKRYSYEFADLWLINVHNGVKEKDIPPVDINKYPAIKRHLDKYYPEIAKRYDKGDTPYNLRNCAYMEDFSKQKIVWGNLCLSSQYALVEEDFFVNAPSTMIVPGNKYLLAILNSKVADWYIRGLGVTRNGGYFEYKPMFVEKLPVPQIPEKEEQLYNYLIDEMLDLKRQNQPTDKIEKQLEEMVYSVYGLTKDEQDLIKG
ncbi:MAG: Eco57I restriction-modification methylase domain-containing protein [Methanomicrobiaceae archaeon]|nr:Eco57I restriction-modification methylase domain-containing protein [Methanomicrobiaceae archaeon]